MVFVVCGFEVLWFWSFVVFLWFRSFVVSESQLPSIMPREKVDKAVDAEAELDRALA